MDVFALREELVGDYRAYAESFLTIEDDRIRGQIEREFDRGLLWPQPRIQLSPAFESGGLIDEAVDDGLLESDCSRIFRTRKEAPTDEGDPLRLHRHQREAIEAARRGENHALVTGRRTMGTV